MENSLKNMNKLSICFLHCGLFFLETAKIVVLAKNGNMCDSHFIECVFAVLLANVTAVIGYKQWWNISAFIFCCPTAHEIIYKTFILLALTFAYLQCDSCKLLSDRMACSLSDYDLSFARWHCTSWLGWNFLKCMQEESINFELLHSACHK